MFYDRQEAALALAAALEKYKNKNVVVIGIPRGGIETAFYIAQYLKGKLGFVIVRKLGYPLNPEEAFGAMAEDGTLYLQPNYRNLISQEMADAVEEREQRETERRKLVFRTHQLFPDIKGKTVIIADDGIATGATIMAAIKMCRKKGAATIVVAAPVCPQQTADELEKEADEVVIMEKPQRFRAVSQVYELFENLTDQETLAFIDKWQESIA